MRIEFSEMMPERVVRPADVPITGEGFGAVYRAYRKWSHANRAGLGTELGVELAQPDHLEAAVNGLLTAAVPVGLLKTDTQAPHPLLDPDARIVVALEETPERRAAVRRAVAVAAAQRGLMQRVNTPSNFKQAGRFAETVRQSADHHGFACEVWDETGLEAAGFHALLAVNRGSEHPARFLVLEYKGPEIRKKIGLIGKGVTYDSGGYSIKPTDSMMHMRSDMAGAATVVAAFEAAADLRLPLHLVGAIPLTDNLVDARSYRPGDVIGSHLGKTIEVADTDAEGRLILADALSWITERHPDLDHIVDLATLTGAAIRALGPQAAALFATDDHLARALSEAGETAGERVWRLPLWDVYADDLHSDVADIRNIGAKPVAGAITAAKFLQVFTRNHPSWAHIDIAGTAYGDTEFGRHKNATGWGLRLLLNWWTVDSGQSHSPTVPKSQSPIDPKSQ